MRMRRPAGDLTAAPEAIVRELRAWIAASADARVRAQFEKLVPGAHTVGIQVPALRAKAVALRKAHRDLPLEAAADIVDALFTSGVREEIMVGTFWLARYGKKLLPLPWSRIAAWLPALDNWETCDQLAMGVAAPVLDADPDPDGRLVPLASSRSLWTRRFALAAASALNQKGRARVTETLAVCAPLVADPAPEVRKAVGWALRTASEHDPEAVERFLRDHMAAMHPTVLREGAEKLPVERQMALTREEKPTRSAEPRGEPRAATPPSRTPKAARPKRSSTAASTRRRS